MGRIFRNLKWKIKNLFSAIKNLFFLARYPFMWPRNVWTGKKLFPSFTEYDCISEGWRKAFGKQLLKDLKKALKEDKKEFGHKSTIHWTQIKEKYGELRLYADASKRVHNVLNHYESLSICYCANCGKPVRYCTTGWIEYLCKDCFEKDIEHIKDEKERQEYRKHCRLMSDDIPRRIVYDENGEHEIMDDSIDYLELWGLKQDNEK